MSHTNSPDLSLCLRFLQEDFKNSMPASTYQQQKLRVCEVCGAYLGIHDNDRRLADHFGGKLHIGFIEIRDKLEELKVLVHNVYRVVVCRLFVEPVNLHGLI